MATYRIKPTDDPYNLAKKYGVTAQTLLKSNGLKSLTPGQTIKVPLTKGGPAGYYTTGANERKTFTQGGNIIRMGPNSTLAPTQPINPILKFGQSIKDMFTGNNNVVPGGSAGVRGSLPPSGGGKNARPIQGFDGPGAGGGLNQYNPVAYELAAQNQFANEQAGSNQTTALVNQVQYQSRVPSNAFRDYGIPETVRNTLVQNWGSSLSLDMAARLYPNMTNQQLISRLQESGATFNMKTNSWDLPTGMAQGTTTNPNSPAGPTKSVTVKTDYLGRQSGDSSTNYGQVRTVTNSGTVINKDTRNIKPLEDKWGSINWSEAERAAHTASLAQATQMAETPISPTGEANSLVTWRF